MKKRFTIPFTGGQSFIVHESELKDYDVKNFGDLEDEIRHDPYSFLDQYDIISDVLEANLIDVEEIKDEDPSMV